METTFTVDYFINKFQAIPEEQWTTEKFSNDLGQHCALGFCGWSQTKDELQEGRALIDLCWNYLDSSIAWINDGLEDKYQESTPKSRVLAALNDIKKKQEGETSFQPPDSDGV